MWMIRIALKNPYGVAVLALMIIVLGTVAAVNLPIDILPVFKAPAVQVMTYFGGMPTSSVEKTITNRVERWTNQAAGCQRVESKSTLGVSTVRLYFRDDIDPTAALTQVNSLALGTLPTLPPGTLPPVVFPFDPTATLPLGLLSVTSPDLSETAIKDTARIDVRNMLGGVSGVVAPAVFGGKDRTILIYVDPRKLEARHLSPMDVVSALRTANVMATPGVAKFGTYEFQLDSNALVSTVRELNDIPIRLEPGNNVYLRDVGRAEDSNAIQTALVRINGRRQVYVPVYRQQGASSLAVVDGVKTEIPHMEEVLRANDKDVKLDLVMDQSVYVRQSIEALLHEGAIGAVLVAVMILLFLGNARMTVIALLAIPLALLSALVGLLACGHTINVMTLGGLALAIGPLVDGAIVVLENTHRHHAMGKGKLKAAFDGANEVMVPVLIATLTTIIVLCPIALMPGMGGFLFKPLALAVGFAMLGSYVLSATLVPTLCSKWLGEHHHHSAVPAGAYDGLLARLLTPVERLIALFTRGYERLLRVALRHRFLVLTVVTGAFAASLFLLPGIGKEFFPAVDAGQITLYVRCPSGTNLEETERRVAEVEAFVQQHVPADERQMLISEIGLVPDWSAAYTPNSATWDANIKVQLTDERTRSAQEYASLLRQELQQQSGFSDLDISFNTGGMVSAALNYGSTSPIDVQVEGGTAEQGLATALKIRDKVALLPGAVDVRVLQRLDAPQKVIEVDRKLAAEMGLSEYDVISQVATAMNSSVSISRNFWIDARSGNQYFVAVQYEEDPDRRLGDVLNVVATGTNQKTPIKLSSLVRLRPATAAVEVNHANLYRTFDVLVNTQGRDLGHLADDINDALKDVEPPTGVRLKLSGEYARMQDSFGKLGLGMALASVLVYLLLVVLFRSFLGPFIIMFTVPLGLIGVFTILHQTHTTLNVQSFVGIIFLVGIAVANGVLLVDFANRQFALHGGDVRDAIATAAAIRFRPILMTFLATFLDLLPMAIGLGRGSEANIPLARAVVGGLLSSTTLTLFFVPVLYTLVYRRPPQRPPNLDGLLSEHDPASGATPAVPPSPNGDQA